MDVAHAVRPRVLVVDDDPASVKLVKAVLQAGGCDVEAAYDGPDALRAAIEHPPDVVLLDVMMPVMDGIQVLDLLRADPRLAAIPVILVTANTADEDLLAGYRSGADYYIPKPFTETEILHGVSMVLGRHVGA